VTLSRRVGRSASPRGGAFPWCELCDRGSYAPRYGMVACLPCPKGSFAADTGSAVCTPCPAGQSTVGPGAYAAGDCNPYCTPGTFSAAGADTAPCLPCPRGAYAPDAGMGACLPCPPGQWTPEPLDGVGAAQCRRECLAGQNGPGGIEPCAACAPGTFSAEAGASECQACQLGKFTESGGATQCLDCPDTCELVTSLRLHPSSRPVSTLPGLKDISLKDISLAEKLRGTCAPKTRDALEKADVNGP
jgi:hypothetical protein